MRVLTREYDKTINVNELKYAHYIIGITDNDFYRLIKISTKYYWIKLIGGVTPHIIHGNDVFTDAIEDFDGNVYAFEWFHEMKKFIDDYGMKG